jgi:hypothetical protein
MTGILTDFQMTCLRGLLHGSWTSMAAIEMGNPGVSELQSCDLVKIRSTDFAGYEWIILPAGRAKLEGSA